MNIAIRLVGLSAIFFYVLCWFVNLPVSYLWGIGVSLPWLSLIVSVPVHLLVRSKEDGTGIYWGVAYIIITVVYVAVAYLIKDTFLQQLPYLATCVTLIAYFSLEHWAKR